MKYKNKTQNSMNKSNMLTMDLLVNILFTIDKANSNTECPELQIKLRWVKPGL